LTHALLPRISSEVLARMAHGQPITRVAVDLDAAGEFRFEVS
jgi:hypothetical protein